VLDNKAIARVLWDIAHLLEIKGDNPFKVMAYRNGAELVGNVDEPVGALDEKALREWPGIGRDLAARIREIAETGDSIVRRELLEQLPATLLDILRLPGLGPRTVARLYGEIRVATLDDLEQAARTGRIRAMKGMGEKKEAAILTAIERARRPPAV
jgi:DNA polymerase (family 10)